MILPESQLKAANYLTFAFSFFVGIYYLYCLIYYPYALNYQTSVNDYYYVQVVLALVFLILFFKLQSPTSRSQVTKAALMLGVLILVLLSIRSAQSEYAIVIFSMLGLGGLFCISTIRSLKTILIVLFLGLVYEVSFAALQIFNTSSEVTYLGTFHNSGILCIYLVIHVPFLYYLLFGNDFRGLLLLKSARAGTSINKKGLVVSIVLFTIYCLFVISVSFKVQSRTALFSILIIFILFICQLRGRKLLHLWLAAPLLKRISVALLLTFLLTIFFFYLFSLKSASSFGHWLLLKVGVLHLNDNFWFGSGIGKFSLNYPYWQAAYFKGNNFMLNDWLSAGESFIIFNEYVQLFETIGFVGFFCCSVAVIYCLFAKSSEYKSLISAAKATLLGILAAGLTSYPLHVNTIIFLFVFCIAIIIVVKDGRSFINDKAVKYFNKQLVLYSFIRLAVGFLVVYNLILSGYHLVYFKRWQELRTNYRLSDDEISVEYENLYKIFKSDGKFLAEYGMHLAQNSEYYLTAIKVLEEAKVYYISKEVMLELGSTYKRVGDVAKSVENYEWLSNFIPNLFRPKLELLKLYKGSGDTVKAYKYYSEIMSMPVKIPSIEVERIKEEAKLLIGK